MIILVLFSLKITFLTISTAKTALNDQTWTNRISNDHKWTPITGLAQPLISLILATFVPGTIRVAQPWIYTRSDQNKSPPSMFFFPQCAHGKENGIIFDFVIRFGYIIEFYKDGGGGYSKVLQEEHCGAPGLGFEINIVFVESVGGV